MNRYALASDVRDALRDCLGSPCEYEMVIARGEPSEECNQVAIWYRDSTLTYHGDCENSCDAVDETIMLIKLTRVCVAPAAQRDMDWRAEEDEARCFYRDLELIECCLDGSDAMRQIRRDHGLDSTVRTKTTLAQSARGGAYSATIMLRLRGFHCC